MDDIASNWAPQVLLGGFNSNVNLELGIHIESLGVPEAKAPTALEETAMVERAKADSTAFGPLFEAHYEQILNYAYRSTFNRSAAEEITSNTFFKALRGLPRYRYRFPFAAWLYRIATNEVRLHWRGEARRQRTLAARSEVLKSERIRSDAFPAESEEDCSGKLPSFAQIHELLKRLPEHQRTALTLRFFQGLPYDAMAQVLGKRVGTVKCLVHRGIQRLKILLERDATFRAARHSDS